MKAFVAAILAIVAVAITAPANADAIDRSDPVATAQAFLTAYRAKDVNAMAVLANQTNEDFFGELAAKGEAHEAFNDVFSGWRWEAMNLSDKVGEVRYDNRGAMVFVSEMPGDEVGVIALTNDNGVWGIEDINSPTPADFNAMSARPVN